MPKRRQDRPKKRKYWKKHQKLNKRRKRSEPVVQDNPLSSDSESGSSLSETDSSNDEFIPKFRETPKTTDQEVLSGNIIFDIKLLLKSLDGLLTCKSCDRNLSLFEKSSSKIGLFCNYYWHCKSCNFSQNFFQNSLAMNGIEEINFRLFYSLRCIGQGAQPAKVFCGLMNLDQPRSQFDKYQEKAVAALEPIAEESMVNAAEELLNLNNRTDDYSKLENINNDVIAGFDCSWPKRGFSSLQAVVTTCSPQTKKILDVYPMCKICQICRKKKSKIQQDEESKDEQSESGSEEDRDRDGDGETETNEGKCECNYPVNGNF